MYLRTLFGAAPYRHYLSVPLLSLYCVLVLATALPRSLLPKSLVPAHRASARVFKQGLGYMPGVNLFRGVALDRKVTLACLTVIGVRAGQQRIGFQTYPDCVAPAVQVRGDSVGFGLTRVAWLLSSGGRSEQSLTKNDDKLAAFGRYFCRSPRSPLPGSDDVVFVNELHVQDYTTGAVTAALHVLHVESCTPHAVVPYTAHKQGGQIRVAPEAGS